MEIKCEYCGSIIKETDEKCPYCGATNQAVKRTADHTPKTIEELQQWYQARNLPPYEVTRFFIGINYTQPKAFGIYREGQNVIVYKNKANGERAIRYQGTDEAYAVNELYLKLKEEILNQKEHNRAGNVRSSYGNNRKPMSTGKVIGRTFAGIGAFFLFFFGSFVLFVLDTLYRGIGTALFIALIAAAPVAVILDLIVCGLREKSTVFEKIYQGFAGKKFLTCAVCFLMCFLIVLIPIHNYKKASYYQYQNTVYVHSHNNWFEYDGYDYDKIDSDEVPDDILNNRSDYEMTYQNGYDWDNSITNFEDSRYYEEHYGSDSSDSSSDSVYDWDSNDSWDSNSSDWDSDW